jgi:hypothetical protein
LLNARVDFDIRIRSEYLAPKMLGDGIQIPEIIAHSFESPPLQEAVPVLQTIPERPDQTLRALHMDSFQD